MQVTCSELYYVICLQVPRSQNSFTSHCVVVHWRDTNQFKDTNIAKTQKQNKTHQHNRYRLSRPD